MEPTQEGPPQRPVRPRILDEGSGGRVQQVATEAATGSVTGSQGDARADSTAPSPKVSPARGWAAKEPPQDELLDAEALLAAPAARGPVRPIALEASASEGAAGLDGSPAAEPQRTPPPAAKREAWTPAATRVPCPECGYDLRANAPGSKCPECGAIVPSEAEIASWGGAAWSFRDELRAALRAAPESAHDATAERQRRREEQLDAWSGLATASLGAIVLVSPIPFAGSVGLVAAAAVGFAPLFRLIHLRTLAAAPAPIVSRLRVPLSRAQSANLADLAIGGVVALFALAGTLAALPPTAGRAYPMLIAAWGVITTLSLLRQIDLALASNRVFTPPESPTPPPPKHLRDALVGGLALAIVGGAAVIAAGLLAGSLSGTVVAAARILGTIVFLGGMALFGLGAVKAWTFLSLASRAAFESPVFRTLRTQAPDLDALPEGVVRHAKTPDHGPPVVEAIELPPPSAEFLAGKDDRSNDGAKDDARGGTPRHRDA